MFFSQQKLFPAENETNKVKISLLNKWASQVTELEDAFGRDESDAQVVCWDPLMGHFPFTNLDLVSSCIIIKRDQDVDLERLPQTEFILCLVLAGELASWDSTLDKMLGQIPKDRVQGIRLFSTERPQQQIGNETVDIFEVYEEKLAVWSAKDPSCITVRQIPINFSPLGDDIFLLKTQSEFFPSFEFLEVATDHATLDIDTLDREQAKKFEALAVALARVGLSIGCRWEAWALGPNSTLVSQFINYISNTSTQILDSEHKGSLILIDRLLDLATPLTMGHDCIGDRYFNIRDSINDVSGNPTKPELNIIASAKFPMEEPTVGFGANLGEHAHLFRTMCKRPKECFTEVRKMLVDYISEIGAELPNLATQRTPGAVIGSLLEAIMSAGASHVYKRAPLIMAAQALCLMSDENAFQLSAGLTLSSYALTKHLLASPDLQNVMEHLETLLDIKSSSEFVDFRFILCFVILAFALENDEDSTTPSKDSASGWDDFEDITDNLSSLKAIMCKLLIKRKLEPRPVWIEEPLWEMLDEVWSAQGAVAPSKQLTLAVKDKIESIMESLVRVRKARKSLQDYPRVVPQPGKFIPLVRQVATHVFEKRTVPLTDLKQVTFSVRGLLKTLGRLGFGSTSLPRPTDRPICVIFVVGGITCAEIREIKEVLEGLQGGSQSLPTVLIGSTTLLTAPALHDMLLTQPNLT